MSEPLGPMTAERARRLLESANEGPDIARWVEVIDKKIAVAALAMKRSVVHPFSGLRMLYPTSEAVKAIRLHYERFGFEWIDHADPDPGHPASHPYTEIKW